jgi:hypothetical protein
MKVNRMNPAKGRMQANVPAAAKWAQTYTHAYT